MGVISVEVVVVVAVVVCSRTCNSRSNNIDKLLLQIVEVKVLVVVVTLDV